jgi:hypothetical protein
MKLAVSGASDETLIAADGSGVKVAVSGVQSAMRTTAAPATPVAVRLSTGSASEDTLPITVSGTMGVSGALSLTGTIPVSGTVAAHQGTAGSSYAAKLTDGLQSPQITLVGGVHALNVNKVAEVTALFNDKGAFVEGTGETGVSGAILNDSPGTPSQNTAAVCRITSKRGLHANIHNSSAIEIGGTTPVASNLALAHSVSWRVSYGFIGSTGTPGFGIYTSPPGYTAFLQKLTMSIRSGAGGALVKLFDQTDSATAELYNGRPGVGTFTISYTLPQSLSAPGNAFILFTDSASNGDITISGFYRKG